MKRSLFILIVLFASCTNFFEKRNEQVLARVHDEYLYESDISGLVPKGTSPSDSLVMVKGFIENWIQQQLVLRQAKANLSNEQLDFSRQMENYKNSLIIYTYENALIRQSLDTLVTEEEMQEYYDQHQQSFLLKENIVQFQYVKLPSGMQNIQQFKRLLSEGSEHAQTRLSELCEKQAADYFLDDQSWFPFSDLLRQIPVKTYNQEDFLKNNREFEIRDSLFTYLVKFRDFRIRESVSPFDFEKKRIRDILINKRKLDLLNTMREDIRSTAQKNNDIEIY